MKRAKVNARFAITYTEQHLCHVATASLPATVDEEDETTDEETEEADEADEEPEADEADEEPEADEADEETEEADEADEEPEADEADEETESDDETGLSVIFDGTSQDVCMSCRCRRHGRFERGRGFGHR